MNYNAVMLWSGVVFLVTTVWVCIDAAIHRVTTDGNETYHLGNGAGAWARDCVLLWVAAFPWYLIRRRQVFRARTPVFMAPATPAAPPTAPLPVPPHAVAVLPPPAGLDRRGPVVPQAPERRASGMVYECEDCETQLSAGMTACPGCGQPFDVPVPDDIPAETNKLAGFVECVLGRPAMFVPSGSFDEVVTFLDGYTQGVNHYAPKDVRAECLDAFGAWLSDTQPGLAQVPRNRFWFIKIRALYPDDADALRATADLYRDFLNDPERARQPASAELTVAVKTTGTT